MAENTRSIGFEETLYKAADKLKGSMDASEDKNDSIAMVFPPFWNFYQ